MHSKAEWKREMHSNDKRENKEKSLNGWLAASGSCWTLSDRLVPWALFVSIARVLQVEDCNCVCSLFLSLFLIRGAGN